MKEQETGKTVFLQSSHVACCTNALAAKNFNMESLEVFDLLKMFCKEMTFATGIRPGTVVSAAEDVWMEMQIRTVSQ